MEEDFGDWFHRMLEEVDVVDQRYPVKGMLVYRRWGMHLVRAMQRYLEDQLEADGHEPVYFPVLIPESVLGKESDHIAGFEEQVFWVDRAGKNKLDIPLALRPTSETCMYDMFRLWVRSHTDLPVKIHQSVPVYRYETKHTRPLLRGREFLWNEGHTAFATRDDAEKNIATIKDIYANLINELLCIPFEVNRRPDWDKFPGALYTIAFETLMPDGKTLQLATAHNLGQNFAHVFDIRYENENGEKQHVWQTSYGPGFGRLLAAVMAVHGDDKGLVLPPKVAPVQVVVVPIVFKESDRGKTMKAVEKDVAALKKAGLRVEVDAGDERPGAKYYKWEKKGVPVRIEVGPREVDAGKRTLARRDTCDKKQVSAEKLTDEINTLFTAIEDNLRTSAQKKSDERHYTATSVDDLDTYLGQGIVSAGWCQTDDCAKPIEERGTILAISDETTKCTVCGAPGAKTIKVAKTY